jgi:hypothetical protein
MEDTDMGCQPRHTLGTGPVTLMRILGWDEQSTTVHRGIMVSDFTNWEPANDPQDLERLLVARENAGDVAGMTALFEADAVVDIGGGTFLRGKQAIQEFFAKLQVTGFGPERRKFEFGEQRPALICGDLALTSTRSRDGTVTSEVARRQKDGTWLWVIDRYSVSW